MLVRMPAMPIAGATQNLLASRRRLCCAGCRLRKVVEKLRRLTEHGGQQRVVEGKDTTHDDGNSFLQWDGRWPFGWWPVEAGTESVRQNCISFCAVNERGTNCKTVLIVGRSEGQCFCHGHGICMRQLYCLDAVDGSVCPICI